VKLTVDIGHALTAPVSVPPLLLAGRQLLGCTEMPIIVSIVAPISSVLPVPPGKFRIVFKKVLDLLSCKLVRACKFSER